MESEQPQLLTPRQVKRLREQGYTVKRQRTSVDRAFRGIISHPQRRILAGYTGTQGRILAGRENRERIEEARQAREAQS